MWLDCMEIPNGSVFETEVCIIGAGAVGIAVARELVAAARDVVLVESGRFEYDQEVQDLYRGREQGDLLAGKDEYLTSTRLRYFGGTTNHWHGWCRRLDPEDFAAREWVPNSGWPFPRSELSAYYDRACEVVQIEPFGDAGQEKERDQPPLFESDEAFETTLLRLSPPTRFGLVYRHDLIAAERAQLLTSGTVTQFLVDPDARWVHGVEITTLDGRRMEVRAKRYVLATGAIENARLLLASNRVQRDGLGNGRDLVGRYFMEHPMTRACFVVVPGRRRMMRLYDEGYKSPGHRVVGVLRTGPELQERQRIFNSLFVLHRLRLSETPPPLAAEVGRLAAGWQGGAANRSSHTYSAFVTVHAEQHPNPESRVRLARDRDALGVPRTRLDWRLSDLDARSLSLATEQLVQHLGATGRGRGLVFINPEEPWLRTQASPHQAGTTRMHDDPTRGVVDRHGRVHGIDNLWIGGGSLFPTAGCSNPTLTVVALALRLADRLAEMPA